MNTQIKNSTTITYKEGDETEIIIISDDSVNEDYISLKAGDCEVALPKNILYDLRAVLSKYEE